MKLHNLFMNTFNKKFLLLAGTVLCTLPAFAMDYSNYTDVIIRTNALIRTDDVRKQLQAFSNYLFKGDIANAETTLNGMKGKVALAITNNLDKLLNNLRSVTRTGSGASQADLDACNANAAQLTTDKSTLQSQLNACNTQKTTLEQRVKELEAQINAGGADAETIKNLQDQLAEAQQKLAAAEAKVNELNIKLASGTTSIDQTAQLRKDLEAARAELAKAQEDANSCQAKLTTATGDMMSKEAHLAEVKKMQEEHRAEIDAKLAEIKARQAERDQARAERDQFKGERDSYYGKGVAEGLAKGKAQGFEEGKKRGWDDGVMHGMKECKEVVEKQKAELENLNQQLGTQKSELDRTKQLNADLETKRKDARDILVNIKGAGKAQKDIDSARGKLE